MLPASTNTSFILTPRARFWLARTTVCAQLQTPNTTDYRENAAAAGEGEEESKSQKNTIKICCLQMPSSPWKALGPVATWTTYNCLSASCQNPLRHLEGVKAFREKVSQLLPKYKVTYQKHGALREGKMPTLCPAQLLIITLSTRKESRDMLAKYKNTVSHVHHKFSWLENISSLTDVSHFSALNCLVTSVTWTACCTWEEDVLFWSN